MALYSVEDWMCMVDAQLDPSVIPSFPLGICILGAEGVIQYLNPAMERLLGWRLSELRGQPLGSVLPDAIPDPEHALSWTVMLSQAISANETTYINLPTDFCLGPERSRRVCLVGIGTPWIGEMGRRLGTILILLEPQALSRDVSLRDQFLSVVFHELRVPATSILAAAEHLSSRLDPADDETSKLMRILLAEADRLRRLLNQLQSQADARPTAPSSKEQPVALGPLIWRVIETGRLRQIDHTLAAQVPSHLPPAHAERDRILQVLNTLVDNALKYSPPGTPVIVAADANENSVVVTVFDRGPALPEDEARRLFEPTFRGEAAQKTPGQGLGLAIARSVVRAAGGDLWYEAPPSGGNHFCFSLPRSGSTKEEEHDVAQ